MANNSQSKRAVCFFLLELSILNLLHRASRLIAEPGNLFLATSFRKIDELTGEYIPVELGDSGIVVTNWQDEITRAAITNHYKFAINGGTDKHNYNASFSYQDREGIIKTTSLQTATAVFNMTQTFKKKFKISFMMNVGYTNRSVIVSA